VLARCVNFLADFRVNFFGLGSNGKKSTTKSTPIFTRVGERGLSQGTRASQQQDLWAGGCEFRGASRILDAAAHKQQ
jgi:hypothetical protein